MLKYPLVKWRLHLLLLNDELSLIGLNQTFSPMHGRHLSFELFLFPRIPSLRSLVLNLPHYLGQDLSLVQHRAVDVLERVIVLKLVDLVRHCP